ncbi:MAG: ion transporter [Lewinellaceae bacterium]|nr:ion transporter [Phaeodactylibacter sp.]MCB9346480.1 ion transporter [Lewinellaceae bacterium]
MPAVRRNELKEKIHEIIFEADTPAGKAFDVVLLILIVASVLVVTLESVRGLQSHYNNFFYALEWFFTIIFTIEYILRLYCVYRPAKYATSFFGVIDLLAILPTYISLIIYGTQYLLVIRALRLLRVFRIFKLGHFLSEGEVIIRALKASRAKITVFLTFILLLIIIIGSIMYLVEGGQNEGFSSIPRSIYWTVVTLTTVGYGDITPVTELGQFLSAFIMILGYAILAVPTGIVSAEMVSDMRKNTLTNQACRYCGKEGHETDAVFCKYCGERLNESLS